MSNNDFSQMLDGAFQLFSDNEEYDNYVEKFKAKKTSDDTFTPDDVYDAVTAYVRRRFNVADDVRFIRPFYPGASYIDDYLAHKDEYAAGMVVDNPPFSILAQIVDFYRRNGVRFFLFCPYLTCFGYVNRRPDVSLVVNDRSIIYGNGAVVGTSFVHNLDPSVFVENDPDIYDSISDCQSQRSKKAPRRVIELPRNVLRQSSVGRLFFTPFRLERSEAIFVRSAGGYDIFGGGLLVSDAAAERLKQALEDEKVERAKRSGQAPTAEAEIIQLTQTEERLLEDLNGRQMLK